MRGARKNMAAILRRFCRSGEAAAAVEFALILPLLLTMYLGSVELSSAISVDKRIATVSGALGDLVARSDGSITQATLNDYFAAASLTMAPYESTGVAQVVSCVRINNDLTTQVMWSRGYNGGVAYANNFAYVVPDDLKNIAKGGYVIVAESEVSYTPLFAYFFETAFDLYRQAFYLPRFGEYISAPT